MRLVSLSCNHCGAPLEAPRKARFVTCAFCNSRLAVHFTDSTAYTEVLEALDERTERIAEHSERIAEDVDVIRIQNEIERLDREWVMSRERFVDQRTDRKSNFPSGAAVLLAGAIGCIFGLAWLLRAILLGSLGTLAVVVLLIILSVHAYHTTKDYEVARSTYEADRTRLMRELRDRSR